MTRAEIVKICAKQHLVPIADMEKILETFLKTISETVKRGEKVTLSKFGTFTLKEVKGGVRKNPKTGVEVVKPTTSKVHFSPSPYLRFEVKNEEAH